MKIPIRIFMMKTRLYIPGNLKINQFIDESVAFINIL